MDDNKPKERKKAVKPLAMIHGGEPRMDTKSRWLAFWEAYIMCNFNVTAALELINISQVVFYTQWMKNPHFLAQINEIHENAYVRVASCLNEMLSGSVEDKKFAIQQLMKSKSLKKYGLSDETEKTNTFVSVNTSDIVLGAKNE